MGSFLKMSALPGWAEQLDGVAEKLKAHLLRSGGNAGSAVFQAEAQARAPVYTGTAGAKTKIRPGQLRAAIYRAYDTDRSTPELAVYKVTWNHSKAPHGWWMENGNARHAARPFIRPAYYAAKDTAANAVLSRMAVRFRELET